MQVPFPLASTIHSVATGPGPSTVSATKLCGGFHCLMVALDSIPGPKLQVAAPPTRSSIVLGTNQADIPEPLAIAAHTSSGVPGTSTSASTDRWPEGSFFTGMVHPQHSVVLGAGVRSTTSDVGGRPVRPRRDT